MSTPSGPLYTTDKNSLTASIIWLESRLTEGEFMELQDHILSLMRKAVYREIEGLRMRRSATALPYLVETGSTGTVAQVPAGSNSTASAVVTTSTAPEIHEVQGYAIRGRDSAQDFYGDYFIDEREVLNHDTAAVYPTKEEAERVKERISSKYVTLNLETVPADDIRVKHKVVFCAIGRYTDIQGDSTKEPLIGL